MAHSDRDRRGRPHSDKHCPEAQNGGCAYCITGEYKRSARRAARYSEDREIAEQQDISRYIDALDDADDHDPHVYVAGRCIRCGLN